MSFGGFLGLGHSHYPLPWGALKYNTKLDGYETNVTEAAAAGTRRPSATTPGQTATGRRKTHTHYNVNPYW